MGKAYLFRSRNLKILEAFSELRLKADLSHWMVVHESDLTGMEDCLELAVSRSHYIHARVGDEQGPQVTYPGTPEWRTQLQNHLGICQRNVEARKADGTEKIYITPEFGPVPDMHILPFTNQPVAETWENKAAMPSIKPCPRNFFG